VAKKTAKKVTETAPVTNEQSNTLDEQGSHVFPDAPQAPSGSPETLTAPADDSAKGETEAAQSVTDEPTEAPKKGKSRKATAKPSKVNERRVITPKGGAKGAKGAAKEAPAPAESVEITPKRRGRPRKDGLPPGTGLATADSFTPEDVARMDEIEPEIDKNMDGLINASCLLLEVSEKKLYRVRTNPDTGQPYKSFSEYVEKRHNIKGRLGWYQVAAAGVNRSLTSQGVTNLPKTESQARPLAQLSKEPEKQVQAWEVANELAHADGKEEPERRHVEQAVARVTGKPETPASPSPAPSTPVGAAQSNGTIPANTEVSTTEVEEGDDIGLESVAPSISDIEMRDDRWLAQFPLDSTLKGLPLKRFRAAALAYRWMNGARVNFVRSVLTPIIKEAKRDSGVKELDPYLHRVRWGLTGPAPDRWVACDVCKSTGQVPTIGGCTSCYKAGFIVPVR
jgi:hypothetical protein